MKGGQELLREWRARAERAEAEVERLRAALDSRDKALREIHARPDAFAECIRERDASRERVTKLEEALRDLASKAVAYVEAWNNLDVPGDEGDERLIALNDTARRALRGEP